MSDYDSAKSSDFPSLKSGNSQEIQCVSIEFESSQNKDNDEQITPNTISCYYDMKPPSEFMPKPVTDGTLIKQKDDMNASNLYTPFIDSKQESSDDSFDISGLSAHQQHESCRKTCWKIFCGLICNFEQTVFTYTAPLNQEIDRMNYQFHNCIRTFVHTLFGFEHRVFQ